MTYNIMNSFRRHSSSSCGGKSMPDSLDYVWCSLWRKQIESVNFLARMIFLLKSGGKKYASTLVFGRLWRINKLSPTYLYFRNEPNSIYIVLRQYYLCFLAFPRVYHIDMFIKHCELTFFLLTNCSNILEARYTA